MTPDQPAPTELNTPETSLPPLQSSGPRIIQPLSDNVVPEPLPPRPEPIIVASPSTPIASPPPPNAPMVPAVELPTTPPAPENTAAVPPRPNPASIYPTPTAATFTSSVIHPTDGPTLSALPSTISMRVPALHTFIKVILIVGTLQFLTSIFAILPLAIYFPGRTPFQPFAPIFLLSELIIASLVVYLALTLSRSYRIVTTLLYVIFAISILDIVSALLSRSIISGALALLIAIYINYVINHVRSSHRGDSAVQAAAPSSPATAIKQKRSHFEIATASYIAVLIAIELIVMLRVI